MLKRNLFFLFSVTVFALASLVLDLFNYNPFTSESSVFINFYLSLFLSISGIAAFSVYYVKFRSFKNKIIHGIFWPSVRQGSIFALGVVTLLILKGLSLLDWWMGVSVIIVSVLLEMFFQTKRVKPSA